MEPFKFEVRNMGVHFCLPIIAFLIVLTFLLLLPPETYILQQFLLIQVLVIPLSAWCTVFLVYELYHNHAEEILIPFYRNKLFINYAKIIVIFIFMLTSLSMVLGMKAEGLDFVELCLLFTSQTLVISSFSLLAAVFFKSVEISLMIVIMYVATEVITMGDVMPWPHLFYFNLDLVVHEIELYGTISLVSTIIFIILTRSLVKTIERNMIF
ncbi:hypothetical protein FZC66_17815 [Priestia megaterium]|nr:hypothetical protein FZC66_17815 [Priestia megaterium]